MKADESIHIAELEVLARVGVSKNERDRPQRIVVNIDLVAPIAFAEMNDDIMQTVNYCAVAAETRDFVSGNIFSLLETLAASLADHLMQHFAATQLAIEMRKFVLPDASYVAVRTSRMRS